MNGIYPLKENLLGSTWQLARPRRLLRCRASLWSINDWTLVLVLYNTTLDNPVVVIAKASVHLWSKNSSYNMISLVFLYIYNPRSFIISIKFFKVILNLKCFSLVKSEGGWLLPSILLFMLEVITWTCKELDSELERFDFFGIGFVWLFIWKKKKACQVRRSKES
jgi:hypothetical protein